MRLSGKYPWGGSVIDADLRVLSLGAGVQSTTVLLMTLEGSFDPAPACAIFADTGWEPRAVYDHLAWLQGVCEEKGFPLYVVGQPMGIRHVVVQKALSGKGWAAMPLFVHNASGDVARLRRQCTREYKIEPIEKKTRELLGYRPRQRYRHVIESWQGISYDEAGRMRENRHPAYWNRYPLIERRMTRYDCLRWLSERGYPEPPKSACLGCPYHDNEYWRDLRDNAPDEWGDVVDFDRVIREGHGLRGVKSKGFLHRTMVPLSEVALVDDDQLDLFGSFENECEGMCGV